MARKATTSQPDMVVTETHPVRGGLDRVDPDGTLEGWCWWPEQPTEQRLVEVLVDGENVAEVICDEARPDLVQAQVGDGRHAFIHRLADGLLAPGVTVRVGLRDLTTQQAIGGEVEVTWSEPPDVDPEPGSPEPSGAMAEPARLAGNLDRVTRDGWVSGWCWSPSQPDQRVRLAIWVDDEPVGSTIASEFRSDLQDAGIGDGGHGFSYALPYDVMAQRGRMLVSVRDASTGEPLGQPVDLRLGRMAQTEQRVIALEREVRLLRGQLDEIAEREQAGPAADQRATAALFGTIAAFFRDLADSPEATAGVAPVASLGRARDDLAARLPGLTLRVPRPPLATLCVPATLPAEAVHRCLLALHEAGLDLDAEIVLVDDGHADARTALLPSLVGNLHYRRGPLTETIEAVWRDAPASLAALLAPSLRVPAEWLKVSADTLAQHPRAALVAATVVRPDGSVQHAGLALRPGGMLADAEILDAADRPEARFMRRADAVTAGALMMDRAAFVAAGGFPSGYASLDYAMVGLCLRLRAAGRRVLVQPAAAALAAAAPPEVPDASAPDEDGRALRLAALHALTLSNGRSAAAFPGHALVVDDAVPRPDHDAGSVSAFEHMRVLASLGWRVTFAAAMGDVAAPVDVVRLEAAGIEVAQPPHVASMTQYLADHGAELDLVQVYRVRNATMLLPRLRDLAPRARMVFVPADLHFLRAEREVTVTGRDADTAREPELACMAAADATLLFSDHERDLIAPDTDAAKLHLLRWIVRPRLVVPGFDGRSGMLFVGSFQHAPNVDAVEWMAAAVLPTLRELRPGIVLHLVGADPPASVRALAAPDIVVHGWVPDMTELWDAVRLSVAPLRFGAGFKGKVATSLAEGVPMVATAIALEGTGLVPGDGVALADDPADIAREIARLHDDPAIWQALSEAGQDRVAALYSPEAARAVYADLLAALGLPFDPD